jgi:preprotein translocase subunit SecY
MKITGAWRYLWTAEEIRNRLLITFGLLVLYRMASHIPVPGVNTAAIEAIRTQGGASSNLFNILDILSGGTLGNFSVLAMGVYPYITAQIILQLLIPIIPALQQRVQDDPKSGREFQERWTWYLSIPMAALTAVGQIRIFNSIGGTGGAQILPNFGFSGAFLLPTITTILSMVAGTMFAIWLGELISEYGIRSQGLSLIIFSGIVARLPNTVASLLADQSLAVYRILVFVALIAITVFVIVVVTQGRRNVPVMYPGRRMGNRQSMPVRGTLPLLVNMAGMIPIIFAQSILTFPALIAQFDFLRNSQYEVVRNLAAGTISLFSDNTNAGYITIYFIMVVLFSFFYTDVIFQTQNYGENLKKVGAQVPGVTKGASTQKYLERVLRRITLPGALFIGVVAILPFVVGNLIQTNSLSVMGSSLLIVVGVVKDTFFGLETELKLRGYDDSLLVR